MADKELEQENADLRLDLKKAKEKIQDLEKELGKISHVDVPQFGDEVEALPSIELLVDGKVYYSPGDRGRVSKNSQITPSDNIDRFEVAWYNTGLVSTMKTNVWMKNFRFCGVGKLPVVGDEVEVLPGVDFEYDGEEYYKSGDRGRVCKKSTRTESDGMNRFEVAWYRTGKVSTMKTDLWVKNFKFVQSFGELTLKEHALETFFSKLDIDGDGTITRAEFDHALRTGVLNSSLESEAGIDLEPKLGDVMEALPGISLTVNDTEYYISGDRGRVSKETYVTESDGIKRFEVTWYRTKLVSTMKLDAWLKNFKYIGKSKKMPTLGDQVVCLEGAQLSVNGDEYYKPGDKGQVSKCEYMCERDGCEKFEITWYRTSKTSTMKSAQWFKYFQVMDDIEETKTLNELKKENAELKMKLASGSGSATGSRKVKPELGDIFEALPGIELIVNDKTYYTGGDIGQVCKETYVTESDGVERFEVHWYTTGLTSTMREDAWLKNFRLRGKQTLPSLSDEVRCLPNSQLDVDGKEYYRPGDRGRVSKEKYKSGTDGIDRFEVTWYRTGLTSTMKCDAWLKHFQILGEDDHDLVDTEDTEVIHRTMSSLNKSAVQKPIELVTGHPKQSAMGLYHFMRVKDPFSAAGTAPLEEEIKTFVDKIKNQALLVLLSDKGESEASRVYGSEHLQEAVEEIDFFRKVARLPESATALEVAKNIEKEVKDNLTYILHEECSSVYVEGPNAMRDEGRPKGTNFQSFLQRQEVKDAELTEGHVAALRLYTTPAFKYINQPLRCQEQFYDKYKPHPLPLTVAYIAEGIKRLRAAYAIKVENNDQKQVMTLWRGLREMTIADAFLDNQRGGTELAPMSTTTDLSVAAKYAGTNSTEAVLFKIRLDNFMQYGAELKWLSCFPQEDEVVYPPLTYLQPTKRKPKSLSCNGKTFTVYEVKPTIP